MKPHVRHAGTPNFTFSFQQTLPELIQKRSLWEELVWPSDRWPGGESEAAGSTTDHTIISEASRRNSSVTAIMYVL